MRRYDQPLSSEQRSKLRSLAEAGQPRLALRGRMILRHFDGLSAQAIAAELGVSPQTVRKWRRRYQHGGIATLGDRPRPGRPQRMPQHDLQKLIRQILQQPLPEGEVWTVRRVAKVLGLSKATIGRAWSTAAPARSRSRGDQGAGSSKRRKKADARETSPAIRNDEHGGAASTGHRDA